jgi:hypothetical protein
MLSQFRNKNVHMKLICFINNVTEVDPLLFKLQRKGTAKQTISMNLKTFVG